MTAFVLITGLAAVVLVLLRVLRIRQDLRMCREAALQTWAQLKTELDHRREMVPYVIAGTEVHAARAVETVGNACDLAGHAGGVPEVAIAEVRLTSALRRLFDLMDRDPALSESPRLKPLRQRLDAAERQIEYLGDLYNDQARAFNGRLQESLARVAAGFPMRHRLDLFEGAGFSKSG